MDDHVGPCRVGQNKLVKVLRRIDSKELGRKPLLVRDVVKLDGISDVNYIRRPLRVAAEAKRVRVDPRGVARVDAVLDDELGGLLDGRLEPGGVEAGLGYVGNLWRLWTHVTDWPDPQESILFPCVEFIHEILGSIGPGLSHRRLCVLPAVVRALDAAVPNLAGRQGRSAVPADIGLNARREVLVPPNDIILVAETDASGLLAESRRTGHCDPALHT